MNFRELVTRSRSIRRFDQQYPVTPETIESLIELACYTPSAANRQLLRYLPVTSPEDTAALFPSLRWAGYLEEWPGPAEGERPAAYIILLARPGEVESARIDCGIAAQTLLLGATEAGLGGCIIAAFDRERLQTLLGISGAYEIMLVIALGRPAETVIIELVNQGGDIRYYRDRHGIHHVPKRKVRDVIVTAGKLQRGAG